MDIRSTGAVITMDVRSTGAVITMDVRSTGAIITMDVRSTTFEPSAPFPDTLYSHHVSPYTSTSQR
jgi:hypothetical protein